MVHTGQVAAAAATDSSRRVVAEAAGAPRTPVRLRPNRLTSAGSFRAGSPPPVLTPLGRGLRRMSTQHHYQTFPTPPPKTPGHRASSDDGSDDGGDDHEPTPLPWRQLALLAVLSLAEQTALNSISPYLPTMVKSFSEGDESKVGLYVGLLASAFALAQLTTNLFWGYLSDIIGRKPVMLVGTSFLCLCFAMFGFCTKYWQLMVVHVAMGLLNGNAAVVPTCLGELTDRSNQSKAFTWLPVVYSLGSITGPALGGLLVGRVAEDQYPFLAPNILGASLLAVSVVVLAIWYEETLEDQDESMEWSERFEWFASFFKSGKGGSKRPTEDNTSSEEDGLLAPTVEEEDEHDHKDPSDPETWKEIMNRTTVLQPLSHLCGCGTPTGRDLHSDVIGVSLSIAGIFTILFQLILFPQLKARLGNLGTYRASLLGLAVSMALMPWIGYRDSSPPFGVGSAKIWLYAEMGAILVIKNICAVGGLSSVMLLPPKQITNSAPSHSSLGTLNGVAQTLSAAGRSFGPFVSGSLFTLSVHVQPKGELLAWGLFGGITLLGWFASFGIRAHGLESTDDGFEDVEEEVADEEAAAQ
ncbi:Major facilitator superfamily transporter [Apiospora kogelbergensis]|uniref:Major facilitator superfamily transporter n=1 Tax=Apiospora kogelbergensis TaxID=1337665 RepID=UPI0031315FB0